MAQVTHAGLRAFLTQAIEEAAVDDIRDIDTYEHFTSLDNRVRYTMLVTRLFPKDKTVVVQTRWNMYHRKVLCNISALKYEVSISFKSDFDEDNYECDIPTYAKDYRTLLKDEDDDDFFDLFSTQVYEEPTARQVALILKNIHRLQDLRPCPCGRPFTKTGDMCGRCTLTQTGVSGPQCLICLQPAPPAQQIKLPCCGVVLHRGCYICLDNKCKCIHCRQPCHAVIDVS